MAKFLFLQRGDCANQPKMTPEQMEARMNSCMQWMKNGQDEGWLLDPGAPLMGSSAVVNTDSVIDGPFAESKELVGGYSMIEAPDLTTACELAKKTIDMTGAGTIEVREIGNMGP